MDAAIEHRDGGMCVADGVRLGPWIASSAHHRILGNTDDNRPSNRIALCGSGVSGCHGIRIHGPSQRSDPAAGRRWAEAMGYRISRHVPDRAMTLTIPVWYQQPAIGRVGWYYLDDDGGLQGPLDLPHPGEDMIAR